MQTSPILGVNDPLTTIYHAFVIIAGAGTILGGLAFLFVLIRFKGYHLIAKEWQELAQVKAEKIMAMEGKIAELETRMNELREENETLRTINLRLQREVENLLGRG